MAIPVEVSCDVAVIGAGPGGYVAAIRCAQYGLNTVIVDSGPAGGTCLNVGCIPSKAVIHAADRFSAISATDELGRLGIVIGPPTIDFAKTLAWKDDIVGKLRGGVDGLLAGAGVTRIEGRAQMIDGKTIEVTAADGTRIVRTRNLVIAAGSQPVELADLPFGGSILSSTGALEMSELPESLAVVGAGYIGLELGTAFRKLGVSVVVVEMASSILPQYDAALTRPVAKRLAAIGIPVMLDTTATGFSAERQVLTVRDAGGNDSELAAQRVLVTVGRAPATQGWGLDRLDLAMQARAIAIDDQCRTSMTGVYAIGDITGEPMLAHRATAQGELVAEVIAGHRRTWDKRAIPEVCFTDPEIVSVGQSPGQLASSGIEFVVGTFPFTASGRAMTLDRTDGFVRVVARASDHLVLGVQAVGAGVAELSAAMCLALEMGATLADLTETVHAHPTLGEAVSEASLQAIGRALHGPPARA